MKKVILPVIGMLVIFLIFSFTSKKQERHVTIGDTLINLQQGKHRSLKSGTYHGNGIYTIYMDDGGKNPNFTMKFQLIGQGRGTYKLHRIDANDPVTTIYDKGSYNLAGGQYNLNFSPN